MYTFQALQVLIFLIPGLISSTVLNALVVRKKEQKELERVIEALIFTMFIYTFYSICYRGSPVVLDQTANTITYSYNAVPFLWLVSSSIVIPVVLSFLITNDWHMKLARALRISRRTARSSVWFDVFYDLKKHIVIDFENGRRIYGWPMYYSDNPGEPYIFLYRPRWIKEDKFIDTGLFGMLITPEQKIEAIEFLES
jgi:uncharacterized membrane protein YozB (DUF420 family)